MDPFLDGSAYRKASTHRGQRKREKNVDIRPCLQRDSNPRCQCSNGAEPYVPQTAGPMGPALLLLLLLSIRE